MKKADASFCRAGPYQGDISRLAIVSVAPRAQIILLDRAATERAGASTDQRARGSADERMAKQPATNGSDDRAGGATTTVAILIAVGIAAIAMTSISGSRRNECWKRDGGSCER